MTSNQAEPAREPLAETFAPGRPGLPRGRTSLPAEEVRAEQRRRLLRGVMAAVAEQGYTSVTVSDIVGRARVSRKAFYDQFSSKEDCFLAAAVRGSVVMFEHLATMLDSEMTPQEALRTATRSYLKLCADEPEFAWCLFVELPAVGHTALKMRNAGYRQLTKLFADWHAAARARERGWPPVPKETYAAAVGAVHELVFESVTGSRDETPPELEDPIMLLLLALFRAPPRGA